MCSDEWRPSRVESECIVGDGVTFYYPDAKCSPFLGRPTGINITFYSVHATLAYDIKQNERTNTRKN